MRTRGRKGKKRLKRKTNNQKEGNVGHCGYRERKLGKNSKIGEREKRLFMTKFLMALPSLVAGHLGGTFTSGDQVRR